MTKKTSKSPTPASGAGTSPGTSAKKKRVKRSTYTSREVKTTVSAAIGDAFSEIQSLAEEMRETADNMENANMGHMQKCETASGTADELEGYDEPDVVPELAEIVVTTTEMVNRKKRRGPSRDVRFSNAQALLQGAVDALEAFKEKNDADLEPSDNETKVDHKEDVVIADNEAAQTLIDDLDEVLGASPEFPGMFG